MRQQERGASWSRGSTAQALAGTVGSGQGARMSEQACIYCTTHLLAAGRLPILRLGHKHLAQHRCPSRQHLGMQRQAHTPH